MGGASLRASVLYISVLRGREGRLRGESKLLLH